MPSADFSGRYTVRGATDWLLLVVAGQGGREKDGKFTFIASGTLPDLSLISLQLISCLPLAQQNAINHCWRKPMSVGPPVQEKSWLLKSAFLAWGTERARDAGYPLRGVGVGVLRLLVSGSGVLYHLGR